MTSHPGENEGQIAYSSDRGSGSVKHHVLIVDDDAATARALSIVLCKEGFTTTVFHTAADAFADSIDHHFDAALVDIHLPDLNGLVLTQKLRERLGPDVPILVVSGDTSMPTLNSLKHVGATHFFAKPTPPGLITDRLHALLG